MNCGCYRSLQTTIWQSIQQRLVLNGQRMQMCAVHSVSVYGPVVGQSPSKAQKESCCTAKSSLNVAIGSQFTTFDPALNTETANNYVLNHLYAGMFRKDADGKVQNELCESYEVSDDGLTYTFHISPDAKWSDGQQVTANDFVYSYLRALSYGADNAFLSS